MCRGPGLKLMVCMMTMGLVGLMGQGPCMGGALVLLFSTIRHNKGFCCSHDCSLLTRLKVMVSIHSQRSKDTGICTSHTEKISVVASAKTVVCNLSGFL